MLAPASRVAVTDPGDIARALATAWRFDDTASWFAVMTELLPADPSEHLAVIGHLSALAAGALYRLAAHDADEPAELLATIVLVESQR